MGGPALVIELAEAVPHSAMQRLREFVVRSSASFEEKRVGEYDLNIRARASASRTLGASTGVGRSWSL
jgi:hypothetical protein